MNIKSLLIGSAAALAAVSGAQAADAIVAAEPEPLEYVRVCDAFGAGFFYIPGTETCLKIGGYVRTELDYAENYNANGDDWFTFVRAQITLDAREDTEYGTLQSFIAVRAEAVDGINTGAYLSEGYIDIAGLRVGQFFNWWDDGYITETDGFFNAFGTPATRRTAIRYWYDGGQFGAGAAVETLPFPGGDNVGLNGKIQAAFGPATFDVIGSYDTNFDEGAVQGRVTAEIGPGTFQAGIAYFSGISNYSGAFEWQAFVGYEAKATDKLTLGAGLQYDWDAFIGGGDDWTVGVTAGYAITDNLATLATVNYNDARDAVGGFLRLQRNF